eukprot:COSAG02_NODE_36983_length_448_cov_0.670487_1_plen_76_part_10
MEFWWYEADCTVLCFEHSKYYTEFIGGWLAGGWLAGARWRGRVPLGMEPDNQLGLPGDGTPSLLTGNLRSSEDGTL